MTRTAAGRPSDWTIGPNGWCGAARREPSPNFDERTAGAPDLLVIHSISLPPGESGGPAIIELFQNRLDPAGHPYYADIAALKVSAHFLVRRSGELIQFVSTEDRAWHAGASSFEGRERCNDFSIGVELEGLSGGTFEDEQYETLAALTRALCQRYPLVAAAAHSEIAPGRKDDPGPGFDWERFLAHTGRRLRRMRAS